MLLQLYQHGLGNWINSIQYQKLYFTNVLDLVNPLPTHQFAVIKITIDNMMFCIRWILNQVSH